jgi:hypothetical protein
LEEIELEGAGWVMIEFDMDVDNWRVIGDGEGGRGANRRGWAEKVTRVSLYRARVGRGPGTLGVGGGGGDGGGSGSGGGGGGGDGGGTWAETAETATAAADWVE